MEKVPTALPTADEMAGDVLAGFDRLERHIVKHMDAIWPHVVEGSAAPLTEANLRAVEDFIAARAVVVEMLVAGFRPLVPEVEHETEALAHVRRAFELAWASSDVDRLVASYWLERAAEARPA